MNRGKQLRIFHIITGLETGGAEFMLLKLVEAYPFPDEMQILVIGEKGALSDAFERIGCQTIYLNVKRGKIPSLKDVFLARRFARNFEPNIIHGWMYHGCLFGFLLRFLMPKGIKLIWGIRQSLGDFQDEKRLTRIVIRLMASVSQSVDHITYNSEVSQLQHERIGFDSSAARLMDNGFDIEKFRPCPIRRIQTRRALEIPSGCFVFVHIARLHPMKDHETLLTAISLLKREVTQFRMILVGKGVQALEQKFSGLIEKFGVSEHVISLGELSDVSRVLNAADAFILSSAWGEGFPNALGEAMATGLPCIATAVGDVPRILGDSGLIVPVRAPSNLEAMMRRLMKDTKLRRYLGDESRRKVIKNFQMQDIVAKYHQLYCETAS